MIIRVNTATEIYEDFSNFSDIHKCYRQPKNFCDKRYDDPLAKFISQMSKNKDCMYDESYYCDGEKRDAFKIEIDNNTIKISDGTITINLPIESKNLLLNAMKEYQNMLEKYL